MKNRLQYQRGMTLVELTIVMVLVGGIIAGIWITAGMLSTNQKASRATEQVLTLVDNIRTLYAAFPDTTGLNNTYLQNAGVVPPDLRTDTVGTFRNPWGGAVNVTIAGPQQFTLQYTQLPVDACIKLASAFMNDTADMRIVEIQANGATWTTFPRTVDIITTACNQGTTAARNISWIFWLRR